MVRYGADKQKMGWIWNFKSNFTLKIHVISFPPPPQHPHTHHPHQKKIGILNNVFCTSDPGLNGWWVIVRTSKWLIHTHGQTHRCRWWQYPKAKIEHHPSTKELYIENVYYKTNQDLCTILGLGTKAAAVCQVQYKPKKICGWAAECNRPLRATNCHLPASACNGGERQSPVLFTPRAVLGPIPQTVMDPGTSLLVIQLHESQVTTARLKGGNSFQSLHMYVLRTLCTCRIK